jgi:hypothetical protein
MIHLYIDNWDLSYIECLDEINHGRSVKIGSRGERFWVKVVGFLDDLIIGKVDNKLCIKREYDYNDYVLFKEYNVLDTMRKGSENVVF